MSARPNRAETVSRCWLLYAFSSALKIAVQYAQCEPCALPMLGQDCAAFRVGCIASRQTFSGHGGSHLTKLVSLRKYSLVHARDCSASVCTAHYTINHWLLHFQTCSSAPVLAVHAELTGRSLATCIDRSTRIPPAPILILVKAIGRCPHTYKSSIRDYPEKGRSYWSMPSYTPSSTLKIPVQRSKWAVPTPSVYVYR